MNVKSKIKGLIFFNLFIIFQKIGIGFYGANFTFTL